ncbi:MFS transporter [Polymorphospora lycopeni]|uniref:MFS transporter n=1 Tax=Polymorphospora lycopeni TaxID=3140240 RepID=A0ABV5CI78_9ACTN
MNWSQTFAPLRNRAFRYLVAGRTVSVLGNAVAPIALAFAVLDLTGSARDLGLVVGARSLANVLFLLIGGVIADRFPRHLVMVGANLLAAGTQAAIAAAVLTGTATIPLLLGLSVVNGITAALAQPATAAVIGQIVPQESRQQANALNRLGFASAAIFGASLGGLLVAAIGPGWGLAVDAAAFAVAAGLFVMVRVPRASAAERTGPAPNVFRELREGWVEFSSRTWLWAVVLGFCLLNAAYVGGVNVLGPVIADESFGRAGWGLVLAVKTVGMIVGALVALRLRIRRFLFFGVACMAAPALLLGGLALAPYLIVLVGAAFLTGLAMEQFGIAWETTMQEHVPGDKLARVYSYDMLGSFLAIPIGQVAVGPLAEALGTRVTMLGAAALVLIAVLGMLASRDVRRLEHRLDPPAVPVTADPVAGAPAAAADPGDLLTKS